MAQTVDGISSKKAVEIALDDGFRECVWSVKWDEGFLECVADVYFDDGPVSRKELVSRTTFLFGVSNKLQLAVLSAT